MKTYNLFKSTQNLLYAFKAVTRHKHSTKLFLNILSAYKHYEKRQEEDDDNDPFSHESNPMLFPGGPLN